MKQWLNMLAIALVLVAMGACASIGRPEGGPRDEVPPEFVRANPMPGSVNVSPRRIDLYFNENIKLDDVVNKVVVSPVQKNLPTIFGNGRHISVTFRDTLIPDVTYTIDFADAIADLNEGNILDGFTYDFSTGATRDSLAIAGKVFQASNLEPAQGILVGVHSCLDDTAITNLPFDRIAKTNQKGEFVIHNLAHGSYHIFALNDVNRDYKWGRSEDVAFYPGVITPSVEPYIYNDTLKSSLDTDSIVERHGYRYFPDNLLLTWFNENYLSQYLKSYTRPDSATIEFQFGAPCDSMPQFTVINGPEAGKSLNELALLDRSAGGDSLKFWLKSLEMASRDTILVDARYQRTDTLDNLVWVNDTLKLTYRRPVEKKSKKKAEETDSLSKPKTVFMRFDAVGSSTQDLDEPLRFKSSLPVDSINTAALHMEVKVDTTWYPVEPPTLVRDSVNRLLNWSIHYQWQPETNYRFTADSAAITSIYGLHTDKIQREFRTKSPDDYSTLNITLTGRPDSCAMFVDLLNSQDKAVASSPVDPATGTATFNFVDPGTYYLRAVADLNANGRWDTGNIASHLLPEDVYYYPKKISVKKNWDINQSWNINELPVDAQKPLEITKNKPKLKAGEQYPTDDDEIDPDDLEIDPFTGKPYNADAYGRGGSTRSRSSNTGLRNNQTVSRNNRVR